MRIGSRQIGPDHPPFVIAELGVNHDGSVARALELVDAAREAGADAVKVQWFDAGRLLSGEARLARYQRDGGAADPHDMLRALQLDAEDFAAVVERAHAAGLGTMALMSTRISIIFQ